MKEKDTFEQGRLWLRNRSLRRKLMASVLMLLLVSIGLGTWVIDSWLSSGIIRFAVFWGAVTLYTLLLLVLCFYDMLRVKKDL